jgi:cysteine-rich repeat protein
MTMKRMTRDLPLVLFLTFGLTLSACAVELIDDIIDERGVTYCSETTQVGDTSTGTAGSAESSGTTLIETTLAESSTTSGTGASTGDSTDDGTTDTSTEPGPFCGDGVVEGDETCDDMNDIPDDGCNACARDSIIFVTSELYQGNVNGLAGADQRCRMLAAIAELPRFETYRAWLSSSTTSAAERLLHSNGRYVLVNGLVVAQNWDALVSGEIENPINVDEYSMTQQFPVWTSTLSTGKAAPGANFCDDWTAASGPQGGAGLIDMTDASWSFSEYADCEFELHLYCIEQ